MQATHYISTYHTTTKDYRGCTRGTLSRNPPSPDDENPEGYLSGPPDGTQIHETSGQESSDRLFYITGIPDHPGPGEYRGHTVLETFFQKLTERAITPHRTTPGSVGYDLFTPFDFEIQPQEQKIVFTDLAVNAPEGHYVQLMSKSGLIVSYELEVKAGVIDPDFTGNLGVVLKNNSNKYVKHAAGDSIAQLLFIKIAMPTLVLVPVLAKMQRGEHGFGAHTAK